MLEFSHNFPILSHRVSFSLSKVDLLIEEAISLKAYFMAWLLIFIEVKIWIR